MTQYRFISNGGCARCEAMEGIYEQVPQRPHPYCRCTIEAVNSNQDNNLTSPSNGQAGSWDRSGTGGWTWEKDGSMAVEDQDGDGYAETYIVDGYLFVSCCDGTSSGDSHSVEVSVDLRLGSTRDEQDALLEEALQRAEADMAQRALELYEQDCAPCDKIVS